MSRQCQHTLALLPQIKEMLEKGTSHREIEKRLRLMDDRLVHQLLKRERTGHSQATRSQAGKDITRIQIRK